VCGGEGVCDRKIRGASSCDGGVCRKSCGCVAVVCCTNVAAWCRPRISMASSYGLRGASVLLYCSDVAVRCGCVAVCCRSIAAFLRDASVLLCCTGVAVRVQCVAVCCPAVAVLSTTCCGRLRRSSTNISAVCV